MQLLYLQIHCQQHHHQCMVCTLQRTPANCYMHNQMCMQASWLRARQCLNLQLNVLHLVMMVWTVMLIHQFYCHHALHHVHPTVEGHQMWHGFWYVDSSCGGTPDLCSGATLESGFSTHVPFLHLSHILYHVSHNGCRRGGGGGGGKILGALIVFTITGTSIYAPVDHNTNKKRVCYSVHLVTTSIR